MGEIIHCEQFFYEKQMKNKLEQIMREAAQEKQEEKKDNKE